MQKANLLCISRIRSTYSIMTTAEISIADYIISNADIITDMSLHDLARETKTSAATVSRFCRKIGFNGFQAFKLSLTREWLTPDYGITELSQEESVSTLKQKVLMFNKLALDDMILTLDDVALMDAAKLMRDANRVLIIAEGASGSSAKAACLAFQQLGIQCELGSDPYIEIVRISQLDENDLVIGFSYSGRSRNTIDNLKLAYERGVPTLGVVGMPNTPLGKYLQIELQINALASDSFCDSLAARVSECAVCSVLYCLLAHNKEKSLDMDKREIESLLDIKRVDWTKH